jgi:dephospho-CoA kinase
VSVRDRHWLLSGAIGSGKSEVRRILERLGFRTVDADSVGHTVLEGEAFDPVSARWPEVLVDGVIDRSMLARVVFSDPGELIALEAITHPLIFGRIEAELEGFEGVVVVEVPVIETGLDWPTMIVDAADDVRLQRALARGMGLSDARRRMSTQPSREEWLASADLVIPNHGTLEDLEETVGGLALYLSPQKRTDSFLSQEQTNDFLPQERSDVGERGAEGDGGGSRGGAAAGGEEGV